MDGTVRRIRPEDIDEVDRMIRELATYERSLDEVKGSAEDLRRALTAPEPLLFGHVAEAPDGSGLAGFALWYVTYSTWEGQHGLYLEDLFVRPQHRGTGLGKALLAALAAEAATRGYPRVEWWVLDWNEPALSFYRAWARSGWTSGPSTGSPATPSRRSRAPQD